MFIIVFIIFNCCGHLWGTYYLGNHLYMWDGDHKENRIIVLNNDNCVSNILFGMVGGANIIPSYELYNNPPSGYYREYVETVSSNKNWIIVKSHLISYSEKISKTNYWIINKNFEPDTITAQKIVEFHVIGPMDSLTFNQQLKNKNIKLKFTKKYDTW